MLAAANAENLKKEAANAKNSRRSLDIGTGKFFENSTRYIDGCSTRQGLFGRVCLIEIAKFL